MAMFSINDSSLGNFNEADSQYKNTKSTYKNGGYNVYSNSDLSINDNDSLKRGLYYSVRDAHRAKKDRGSHEGAQDYTPNQRITNSNNKPVSAARLNANNIAKELRKRGVSQSEINSEINDARKSSQKEFDRKALRAKQKNGPSISDKVTGNAGINKSVIKKRLEAKGKLKEAAEYILSVLDEENLDEYLNEGNKAIKHIADIESRTNPYENRSSKQIQSDVKKAIPGQMKEISNNYSDEALKKLNNVIKNGRNAVSDIYKNKGAAGQYLAKKASNKLAGYTGAELKRRGIDPKTGEKLKEAAEYILSVLDEMEYTK